MPPLEGLWWAEDPAPVVARRGEWRWTMMNMQPDCIGADMVTGALEEIGHKEVLLHYRTCDSPGGAKGSRFR